LQIEAAAIGIQISIKEVFLSEYVSFHDEIRLEDISRGFAAAVDEQLQPLVDELGRFACITHSTGGPVIRDWWHRYYSGKKAVPCPMSHAIMLAPANFGSALAQLGKSRIGRLKSWMEGVEPGAGVLDWLELGSPEAWQLNEAWIDQGRSAIGPKGFYPFVLTGQSIDRNLYDHLNAYTGELGSDGVVRVAAANLNTTRIRLVQEPPKRTRSKNFAAETLRLEDVANGPEVPMRLVAGKSHSGTDMGIMRSVWARKGVSKDQPTVDAILACLQVADMQAYKALFQRFFDESVNIQKQEQVEIEERLFLEDRYFIHDRHAMVIFRVTDTHGYPLKDFDLVLTAGKDSNPNRLPEGFFKDRQRNSRYPGTITYHFNYDMMIGSKAIEDPRKKEKGKIIRPAQTGTDALGLRVTPRPQDGFVHYMPCEFQASAKGLAEVIKPNRTTLIDIVLQRAVRTNVFRLQQGTRRRGFKKVSPGDPLTDT